MEIGSSTHWRMRGRRRSVGERRGSGLRWPLPTAPVEPLWLRKARWVRVSERADGLGGTCAARWHRRAACVLYIDAPLVPLPLPSLPSTAPPPPPLPGKNPDVPGRPGDTAANCHAASAGPSLASDLPAAVGPAGRWGRRGWRRWGWVPRDGGSGGPCHAAPAGPGPRGCRPGQHAAPATSAAAREGRGGGEGGSAAAARAAAQGAEPRREEGGRRLGRRRVEGGDGWGGGGATAAAAVRAAVTPGPSSPPRRRRRRRGGGGRAGRPCLAAAGLFRWAGRATLQLAVVERSFGSCMSCAVLTRPASSGTEPVAFPYEPGLIRPC